jgi:hypothetical protein
VGARTAGMLDSHVRSDCKIVVGAVRHQVLVGQGRQVALPEVVEPSGSLRQRGPYRR